MLKTFDVAELRPGMHVQRLLGPWMQHPFWRTSFVLDEARLAQLQDSGVQQVVVDLARSQLDDEPFADAVPPEAPGGPQEADAGATAEGERRRVVVPDGRPDFAAELARARRICGDARDAVEAMFREARLGRGVDAGQAMPLIDEITGSVDRHPTALVSVARLKDADSYTYLHSVAVSALMVMLGREIGLTDAQLREAALGGLLHDMGKAAMPLDVLNKPGRLTDEEFDVIRQHPVHGERLLREGGITQEGVLHITRHHHERVDGTGYPDRLPGSALPVLTRMGAICDVYDAIMKLIAAAVGARFCEVQPEQKPLYHAAAVFGSNYVAACLDVAERLMASAGVTGTREDLVALAQSAIANWSAHDDARRFTGPAARGDRDVMARHLAALGDDAEVARLYELLADQIAGALLARQK